MKTEVIENEKIVIAKITEALSILDLKYFDIRYLFTKEWEMYKIVSTDFSNVTLSVLKLIIEEYDFMWHIYNLEEGKLELTLCRPKFYYEI
jgi:hypothetical protein